MAAVPKILTEGVIYKAAHYGTAYLNVPPNKHRLYNAVGLMAGLFAGRKVMDVLVGQTPDGEVLHKEALPLPLQKLHGLLAYDHFSDDPKHRWMKVLDQITPGILGGVGAAMGSAHHFRMQELVLGIKPVVSKIGLKPIEFTIAAAEKTALASQLKPWRLIAAADAVPGSSAGLGPLPSLLNYSTSLSTAFTIGSERAMGNPLVGKWFNSHSPFPFRPTPLIARMTEYLAGNPSIAQRPERLEKYVQGIIKPLVKDVSAAELERFAALVEKERSTAVEALGAGKHSAAEIEKSVSEALKKMLSETGFENTLIKAGIDPRRAVVGDMGVVTKVGRWVGDALGMGTTKKIEEAQKKLLEGLNERHKGKAGFPENFIPTPVKNPTITGQRIIAGSGLALAGAAIGAVALSKDSEIKDIDPGYHSKPIINESLSANSADGHASHVQRNAHIVHSKKSHGFINGKILDTSEGISSMLNASIGLHRVGCAAGLTMGSWLGDVVMEVMTGRKFAGGAVLEKDLKGVRAVLKPLYKILEFNPHSDAPKDKWMQVMRWGIPAIIGAAGAVQASTLFFAENHAKDKKATFLDEVENSATHAQAKPWSYTAAITSLFGFPSGMTMVPLVNYSTNLGTRYSLASGRKVALPVLGKLWSNNSTLFPFGPPGMVDLLIKDAVNNKSHDPELLETYAIGILKPWFENVKAEQIEAFVMKIHEIRDKFLREGGVPEDMKTQLEAELKAHLKGAGLEETLESIGLNPLTAHLANNGLSGKIATTLGAKSSVDSIKANYVKSYTQRHQQAKDSDNTPTR